METHHKSAVWSIDTEAGDAVSDEFWLSLVGVPVGRDLLKVGVCSGGLGKRVAPVSRAALVIDRCIVPQAISL